jgi:hypothetical protein
MNADTEPPSPSSAKEKRARGRPRQSVAETHQQKVERLEVELKEAQAALKVNEEKRATIVGHASLRHARHNVEFARQLAAALRAEVRAKADRSVVADLLRDDGAPSQHSE